MRAWLDHDRAAAHTLADIVMGLAFEHELDTLIDERAEALPSAAAVLPRLGAGERGADSALRVVDGPAWRWRRRRVPIAHPPTPARPCPTLGPLSHNQSEAERPA